MTDNFPQQKQLFVINTPIGWMGVCHIDGVIDLIKIGFPSKRELCQFFRQLHIGPTPPDGRERKMIADLENYFRGGNVSFGNWKIDDDRMTPFQQQVVQRCRQIPAGHTVSYGELAAQSGRPGAARAVGTVMRKNRFPIVVPCHRVVAANGIGGFSGPRGVETKLQLQTIEQTSGNQ